MTKTLHRSYIEQFDYFPSYAEDATDGIFKLMARTGEEVGCLYTYLDSVIARFMELRDEVAEGEGAPTKYNFGVLPDDD